MQPTLKRPLLGTLFILSLLMSARSDAQFEKGMRMPGITIGNAFFNSGEIEYSSPAPTTGFTSSTNSVGFSLAPGMGWFVTDKLVVGGKLTAGYLYDKALDAESNITFRKKINQTSNYGLGVFARNYFGANSRFIPFAQLAISAGSGSSKTEGYNYTSLYKETYTGSSSGDFFTEGSLTAGVTRLLNDHIGIDLFIGYTYTHNKSTFKTTTLRDIGNDGSIDEQIQGNLTTRKNNNGLMIGAGFQLFLGKKKKG